MTNKLTKLKNAYINYMTRRGQIEVHRVLVNQSDRSLEDMGISRELLAGGIDNWPWTAPVDDGFTLQSASNSAAVAQTKATSKPNRKTIAAAVKELSAMSDYQLRDLGIGRGTIRDAVANGRYGIDSTNPIKPSTSNAVKSQEVIAATPKVAKVGVTQQSANDTDQPQPPMTPPSSGGGSRQAA